MPWGPVKARYDVFGVISVSYISHTPQTAATDHKTNMEFGEFPSFHDCILKIFMAWATKHFSNQAGTVSQRFCDFLVVNYIQSIVMNSVGSRDWMTAFTIIILQCSKQKTVVL